MKCILIFPEICAKTRWPLSNETRNIALGKGSTTVPSTSIASSFGNQNSASTAHVNQGAPLYNKTHSNASTFNQH